MSKNLVTILILTLVTLTAWGVFQIFRIRTASTIPSPTQEQIQPLNPTIDQAVLEDLKKALQ